MTQISAAIPQGPTNLTIRLLTALVGLPLLLACVWFGGPAYVVLVGLAVLGGAWEFDRISAVTGGDVFRGALYAGSLAYVIDAYFGSQFLPAILTATILLSFLWSVIRFEQYGYGLGWAWTVGGTLYIGWLTSHYLGLREFTQGREWVLLALLGTFLSDTAAYTVGRLGGKRPLSPRLSPTKTVEGAIGSLVFTTAGIPALGSLLGLPVQPAFVLLGLAISVAAQTGDLAESMLKRVAGLKDVSSLVPGHGGLLDRMDSLVFVGPLVYYYVRWCV